MMTHFVMKANNILHYLLVKLLLLEFCFWVDICACVCAINYFFQKFLLYLTKSK